MSKKPTNKSSADGLEGLSLTGSQVGTPVSSARRPGSAKPQSRPGSAAKSRTKPPSNGVVDGTKRRNPSGGLPLSGRSDISLGESARSKPKQSARDDFLALFETSSQGKGAKLKQKPKPAWASTVNSARSVQSMDSDGDGISRSASKSGSKFSHSVFQPNSARSSSTVDDEDYGNLNLNISSYSSNSAQKRGGTQQRSDGHPTNYGSSPVNSPDRHSSGSMPRPRSDSGSHGDHMDASAKVHGMVDSMARTYSVTPRGNNELQNSHHEVMSQKATKLNTIANNMTSQAFSGGGTKAPLHSMQNSYQNIKPKTPVNEVGQGPQLQRQSQHQPQVGRNIAEDYIKKCNMAATRIQRWFRRRSKRSLVGEAAVRRLLQSKRQEKQEELQQERQQNGDREEERRRVREDKARQARQQAIQELHKKREERRRDNERKAEEEISFLQASGKISKAPAHKSNIKKKVASRNRAKTAGDDSDSDSDTTPRQGPSTDRSVRRKVDDIFQSKNMCGLSNVIEADKDNRDKPTSPMMNNEAHSYGMSREPPQGAAASGGEGADDDLPATHSQAATNKTTLDDLMDTLKKLEADEKFVTPRKDKNEKPLNWLDDLEKTSEHSDHAGAGAAEYLGTSQLAKLNPSKDNNRKSGLLTDEKLHSIMSYLDEVDMAERLSEIDQELQKANHSLERPAPLVPSGEEILELEQASAMAAEVSNTMLSQKMELEDKKRSIQMLQKALSQQRELTVRHARETEREMKKRLDVQKDEYEEAIKRHLSFIDQLIDDKKALTEKCEDLVKELKTVDKKYQDRLKVQGDNHEAELKKMKEITAAAEKLRREKWIDDKTKKIKEMTVKGLEPEIQRLIAKHKAEVKKLKSIHEAELLASDERAGGRYIKMTEELRDQLASEKEAACARERELARQTYEKQLQQEEEAYQQQRRRLYAEVQEEKDRLSQQASRQRTEVDKLQKQLEQSHTSSVGAMTREYEKARDEQEKRHAAEIQQIKTQVALEKSAWEENYRKKQETWLLQKEREVKDDLRRDRDKEIELVIQRLEQDNQAARDECERVADNRIKRIRDKYEGEILELEKTEKMTTSRYNKTKAELIEAQGESERLKVTLRQKNKEIQELKMLLNKHNDERDVVSDVIRQEFADKLVATDEENKRLKNQMSELKARHKVELGRAKAEVEIVEKSKNEEMEEVHKRVKTAILKKEDVVTQLRQQHEAALKRSEHLEGLLEQQRKQLLKISKK